MAKGRLEHKSIDNGYVVYNIHGFTYYINVLIRLEFVALRVSTCIWHLNIV